MRIFLLLLHASLVVAPGAALSSEPFPVVVSTWPFVEAVRAAWRVVTAGFSAIDAVVDGCSTCEELRCDGTVGPGGSPDENGETTLDALLMNGAGRIAVGTSTNGATFKIPGRVGDGPIAGSSAYADDEVGACGATGDGDIMMRFLPCYQVVESMRRGMEPKLAAADAISRIARKYPNFVGAIFALNKNGVHAGACHGWTFQYSVRTSSMKEVEVFTVEP
ncbi:probable isoaspartyl peptidase/L-asparaginase 3 isoform X4 [Phalaenopsis equestris]|uniref:probable isoaspartyl peptidase/L-asparaginase 3 isoform X4 n=1 Tax=Phalaenopsis equestris TaxID=78828 RepID=UPI0009E1B7A4|nr:probable isoaspartyl peptidase/L-asparaginase 3 isoform X4 [Phalaenopsis equestris]